MLRFLPPVNRAMTTLDRAFFQKTFPITAAHVFDQRNIKKVQDECKEDLLYEIPMVKTVTTEEDATGTKKILVKLKPEVRHDGMTISRLVLTFIYA